jgi:hypothetical protein
MSRQRKNVGIARIKFMTITSSPMYQTFSTLSSALLPTPVYAALALSCKVN